MIVKLQALKDFICWQNVHIDLRIVSFVSSGLFALQTKAEKRTQSCCFFYSNIMCSSSLREILMSANCFFSLKFKRTPVKVCMQLSTNLQRKSSGILYKFVLIMIWTGGWRVCSAIFDQLASVNLFTITQKRASSANSREVCHIKDQWFKRYSDPNVRPSVKVKFGFEGLTHAGFHIFSITFY